MGLGDATDRNIPVRVGTAANWKAATAGVYHSLAIRSDGTLWAWGGNTWGQLGLADQVGRGVPVQVGTATNWAAIAAGANHSLGILSDGTLWAWGLNADGQLGTGDMTDRSAPAQVGAASRWGAIALGQAHSVALRVSGSGAGQLHPADANADWLMKIGEMTAYGSAWKKGQTWPVDPNPIPIAYVTRSGYLWKNGEAYHFDSAAAAPLCWVPGSGRSGRAAKTLAAPSSLASITASAVCTAAWPVYGRPLTVSVRVACARGVGTWALEEHVPAGWRVSAVSDGGTWDARSNTVRWGPFMDARSRLLSYTLEPGRGTWGAQVLRGVVSADGRNAVITGERTIRAR